MEKKYIKIAVEEKCSEIAQDAHILCFSLNGYSRKTQMTICCVGLFSLYLIYGYIQELIFTVEGFKSFGWFLTLVQFNYYIWFGLIERKLELNKKNMENKRYIPLHSYIILAILTLGTMGFSNSSLGFLNYPTQVIFKCCKLIPVLIGGIIIQGKKYGPLDFAAAFLMCFGLAWFTIVDSRMVPNFNVVGVLMISTALLCDAAIGNVQEKIMREYHVTNSEIILFSYGLGFCFLLLIMLSTGNFFNGLHFFLKHPTETFGYGFIFSISGYLGIQFVLLLVRSSGAFVAATITTTRKALTIIVSFLIFEKPFTIQYFWSGLIVVLGIYLNLYNKNHKITLRDFKFQINKYLSYLSISDKKTRHKDLIEV